jgi:hypothetical protein
MARSCEEVLIANHGSALGLGKLMISIRTTSRERRPVGYTAYGEGSGADQAA